MLFSPAIMYGEPVSVWVAMPFRFKLNSKPKKSDSAPAIVISDSLRAAVEMLFKTMHMDSLFTQTVHQMLELQLQQSPEFLPFEATMRAFFEKYLSWQSLKEDLIRIYAENFSLNEVNDLIAFYKTPTGQKAIQKIPELMNRGGRLGAQRVQENFPELQRMVEEALAAEKKN
jgi:hypothetical protein